MRWVLLRWQCWRITKIPRISIRSSAWYRRCELNISSRTSIIICESVINNRRCAYSNNNTSSYRYWIIWRYRIRHTNQTISKRSSCSCRSRNGNTISRSCYNCRLGNTINFISKSIWSSSATSRKSNQRISCILANGCCPSYCGTLSKAILC